MSVEEQVAGILARAVEDGPLGPNAPGYRHTFGGGRTCLCTRCHDHCITVTSSEFCTDCELHAVRPGQPCH